MAKESIEKSTETIQEMKAVPGATTDIFEVSQEPLPAPEDIPEETPTGKMRTERRHIVRSATLVMLGNLGSSLMGMIRQIVVAGTGTYVAGPFMSALVPVQTLFDLLVNGSVTGALIPTFNDYSAPEKRKELRRIVFTLVNLVFLLMLTIALVFVLFSPWIVDHMVPGYNTDQRLLTLHFSQITIFSLVGLGPFAVMLAALFAQKEFGWPAFATAAYHTGIIMGAGIGVLLTAQHHGRMGLAFGALIGVVGEIALLIPGLRNQRLWYMFVLDLRHPALRRIIKLYTPVALSFLISAFFVYLDQYLASRTPGRGDANFTAMRLATTLIQFPGGLVATALSIAVLPTLSEHARSQDIDRFKKTLLLGFRLGLLLMIPAAAGLIVLGLPIVELLFLHHHFTTADAVLTNIALRNYAYQLPFVAIDQLLLAAFYARKNTVTPVIVGIVSFAGYLAIALPFWQTVGMPALVLANTFQNSLHPIILIILLRLSIGSISVRETIPTVLKIFLATGAMVAVAWGLQIILAPLPLFSLSTLLGRLLTVIVAGGLALGVFIGGVIILRVEEVGLVKSAILTKLRRK